MKKITLTSLIVIGTMVMAFGQIPNDHWMRFDFTNSSLRNYSTNSALDQRTREGAVITSIPDRFGTPNSAIDISVAQYYGLADPVVNPGTSAQTLSFWIKKERMDTAALDFVVSTYRNINRDIGFWINFNRSGNDFQIEHLVKLAPGKDIIDRVSVAPLDDNKWHHIVYEVFYQPTQDIAEFAFFIDGVQINALTAQLFVGKNWKFLEGNDPIFRIGSRMGIDDIRYYERMLDATERAELFNEEPMSRVYVDEDAPSGGDGTSWSTAFNTAEDAFNYGYDRSELWVAEGTYVRDRKGDFNTNYAFIWELDSIKLYGGFDGTETALSQRDWDTHPTIFSGEYDNDGNVANNAEAVFVGPFIPGSFGYVDGIKITDGYADGQGTQFGGSGAGLFLGDYGDAHFKNIEIYDNYATTGPAVGIITYSTDRTFVLENMNIHDNRSINASAFMLRNRTGGTGSNTKVTWVNSLIHNNHTTGQNTFHGSIGALLQDQGTVQNDFINCTFAYNVSDNPSTIGEGNIMTSGSGVTMNMYNCIMSRNANESDLRPNQTKIPTSTTISNCILDDTQLPANWTLTANQDVDPMFTDTANGDYTLKSGSPAINAGTLSIPGFSFPNEDFAGNPRNLSASIDMGAYEFQGNASTRKTINIQFSAYPNPTNGMVHVKSDNPIQVLEIRDLTGKILLSTTQQNSIDISSLPTGLYLLRTTTAAGMGVLRLVKD